VLSEHPPIFLKTREKEKEARNIPTVLKKRGREHRGRMEKKKDGKRFHVETHKL
jgi:hypothetical protein